MVPLVERFQVVVRPVASVLDDGAQGAAPPQPAARLLCHFLPKFDNQAEGRRLCDDPIPEARCLSVSKKHSGHLVMCPPFYSKNGSANPYSRMGELLLRAPELPLGVARLAPEHGARGFGAGLPRPGGPRGAKGARQEGGRKAPRGGPGARSNPRRG